MRAYTRAKALENRAFLGALTRTGNARAAAEACGLKWETMYARRRRDPALALEWDAALAVSAATASADRGGDAAAAGGVPPGYHKVRLANGRVQLRRVRAGGLDSDGEQRFLTALSATANVGLSARAAGFSPSSIYQRARIDPGFAREMRLALQIGYERLEFALIRSFTAASHRQDAWRHNDPPEIPPMRPEQALQQLHLHHKAARMWSERPWEKPRAGETTDQWSARMATITRVRERRAFEDAEVARAEGRRPEPKSRFEGDMAVYDLSEKLRAEVLAAAPPKAQPAVGTVRWAKLRLRQTREAAEAGEAPAEREVRMRRTGEAMFGGWRVEE